MAYLLYNSSGRIDKILTEFFAVLERILVHFGTPSGTPLLTLPPTSSRCYSVLEQEAGGGSVQCVQGGGTGTRTVVDRSSKLKGTVHKPVGLSGGPQTQNVYIFV